MSLEYLRCIVLLAVLLVGAFALSSSGVRSPEEFNADSSMEIQATQEKVAKLLADHAGRDYLLFPEGRLRPIRMLKALPHRWIESGPGSFFRSQAKPGEYYVFQIGLFAVHRDIPDFQQEARFRPGDSIRVPAGKGYPIVIEKQTCLRDALRVIYD